MAGIFVSYRRADSARWCARLSNLDLRFGQDPIFRDVEDIAPGDGWRRRIDAALRGAEIVLAHGR